MPDKPVIASFWVGGDLRWIERLSLMAFVHHGYAVKLFSPDPIAPGIDGVECLPSQEVVEFAPQIRKRAAPSFMADIFRLYLQKKTDYVWMDTDMLPVNPVSVQDGYVISWTSPRRDQINNAALRLPKDSPALDFLIEHIETPSLIPDWMKAPQKRKLREIAPENRLLAQGKMMRIVYGPRGLSHALLKHGEEKHAQLMEAHSPVPWWLTDLYFSPRGGVEPWITDKTQVAHLFWDQLRSWHKNRPVQEGSFVDRYMKEVGFER